MVTVVTLFLGTDERQQGKGQWASEIRLRAERKGRREAARDEGGCPDQRAEEGQKAVQRNVLPLSSRSEVVAPRVR